MPRVHESVAQLVLLVRVSVAHRVRRTSLTGAAGSIAQAGMHAAPLTLLWLALAPATCRRLTPAHHRSRWYGGHRSYYANYHECGTDDGGGVSWGNHDMGMYISYIDMHY